MWEWRTKALKYEPVAIDMTKIEQSICAELADYADLLGEQNEGLISRMLSDPGSHATLRRLGYLPTPEEIAQRTQDIRYHFCQRRHREPEPSV